MDKHTKNLIRICASLAGLIVVFIIDKVAGPKQYILGVLYGIVYLSIGWDVLLQAAKNIGRGKLFDENFLMSIATVGAFVIGEYPEAVAVMLFYQVRRTVPKLRYRQVPPLDSRPYGYPPGQSRCYP